MNAILFTLGFTVAATIAVMYTWACWPYSWASSKLIHLVICLFCLAACAVGWIEIWQGYTFIPKCVRYVMA